MSSLKKSAKSSQKGEQSGATNKLSAGSVKKSKAIKTSQVAQKSLPTSKKILVAAKSNGNKC